MRYKSSAGAGLQNSVIAATLRWTSSCTQSFTPIYSFSPSLFYLCTLLPFNPCFSYVLTYLFRSVKRFCILQFSLSSCVSITLHCHTIWFPQNDAFHLTLIITQVRGTKQETSTQCSGAQTSPLWPRDIEGGPTIAAKYLQLRMNVYRPIFKSTTFEYEAAVIITAQ